MLKLLRLEGWDKQDERVLFEAEREAERFAASARLVFSIVIAALLLILAFVVNRWNEWVTVIAITNIAMGITGVALTRSAMFPHILPWIGVVADTLLLFGIGWFGPWLESLPPGARSAMVSPWGAFLILAITGLSLNAASLVLQTCLLAFAIGVLLWWPSPIASLNFSINEIITPLFSDGANAMRLGIILLTGLAMALAAFRARRTLMSAIKTARERALLGRFNAEIINRYVLSEDTEKLRNGLRQRVCVLFADIRGFTTLSESLDPSQVASILNSFRTRVELAVQANGGVIDKFIGDGALAIFGLPSPRPGDARNALNAAIMLSESVMKWSAKRQSNGKQPIEVGIGVHIGDAFVGLLGDQKLEFTVIGDTVNVGQRLQADSGKLSTTIAVSEIIFQEFSPDSNEQKQWTRHDDIHFRGRSRGMNVYTYKSVAHNT